MQYYKNFVIWEHLNFIKKLQMKDDEESPQSFEFDQLQKLMVEFTDGRKRTYWADSYEVSSSMIHLFCTVNDKKKISHMIPYMMVRQIEVQDQEIRGLLRAKG